MNIALHYEEYGSGAPLILLHGNGEDSTYFRGQIGPLSAFYRVIAVDTRGHGRSPRGSAPFTIGQFARDLGDFMDERGIEKADLLGFSDGGNIALTFALSAPERVEKLVLCGANLFPAGLKPLTLFGIDAAWAFLTPLSPLSLRIRRRAELLRLMAREPQIDPSALSKITMPSLVVAGTRDVIRERHTRLIAESLPNARLCILPGGHTVAAEDPERFNRAVLEFLGEA
ncbi:MAG: alpha/beta fold hydrolase [Oscillospiraceae bacterium]